MPSTVWTKEKVILVHPPRTGGTSLFFGLETNFGPGDFTSDIYPHRTLEQMAVELDLNLAEYFTIITTRSPFSRVVSWLNWHRTHNNTSHDLHVAIEHVEPLTGYGLREANWIVEQENFAKDLRRLEERLSISIPMRYMSRSLSFPVKLKENHVNEILKNFKEEIALLKYSRPFPLAWAGSGNIHGTYSVEGEPSGYLVTLWNCNEQNWRPDQVYLTVVAPGGRKGPHLHGKRVGRFFCIKGRVKWTTKELPVEGPQPPVAIYRTGYLDDRDPTMFEVPTGVVAEFRNELQEEAYLMNMPSPAWKPDDQDELPIGDWSPPDVL